jgi:hypothetical protein
MGGVKASKWKSFWKSFAHTHSIAWDKLPKGTLNKVSGPEQAKKGLAFWVIKGRKENPFATSGWSYDRTLGNDTGPSVVAVTLNNRHGTSAGAAVGLGVRGTLMVKKLKELVDDIYVMDFESFRGGTKALKAKRAELKLGKDTFKDARAWKQANLDRYKDIINARVGTRDQVDAMTAKIVKIANKAVEEGMTITRTGKYDDLITAINGNDVPLNTVTSAMSRALRSYAEYIRYANQAEEDKKSAWGGTYNEKGAKETAGYIKKILNAFEQGNANKLGRF